MDDELEVIHHQMEETRASLANKLEELESQVRETVQSASDTVASAVDGAKEVVSSVSEGAKQMVDSVSETVETVKESLSINRYVERYPWASLGVAVTAGFCVAQLLPSRRSTSGNYSEALPPASSGGYYPEPPRAASSYQPTASETPRQEQGPSWTSALGGILGQATGTLEGLAVGTLMGAIKEFVSHNLPHEWQGELTRVVDDVTTRLGGKVMQGNPLDELLSAFQSHQGGDQPSKPADQGPRM